MQAYWEAVQERKGRRLSLREIAGKLGTSRVTVTEYAKASPLPTASAQPNRKEIGD